MRGLRAVPFVSVFLAWTLSWSEEAATISSATFETADSARAHLEQAEKYRDAGDKWRACAEYAKAWRMGRADETRDVETVLRAAGPYCRLLFDFSLLDPLWWVARESFCISKELEELSPEAKRSLGWIQYWLLMRWRVEGAVEAGFEYALEALRIAGEVNDATLRAWTRLERSRLYILTGDAVSAEVEILRCRGEPLYQSDIDYRSQCELRMQETHLAAGRFEHAAAIVDRFVEGKDVSYHYRTESLFLQGDAYLAAGEYVRAVGPLLLGCLLHPEQYGWHRACDKSLSRLYEGRSEWECVQLLELARGLGPRDATAAIDLELSARFPEHEFGIAAAGRIDAITPGSVLPITWQSIQRRGISSDLGAAQIAGTYCDLIRRCGDNFAQLDRLVFSGVNRMVTRRDPPDSGSAFLETVRSDIPEFLYRFYRMGILWEKEQYREAGGEARLFLDLCRDAELFREYPYLRVHLPYKFIEASSKNLMCAYILDGEEGLLRAVERLFAEAPDPVIVQRVLWDVAGALSVQADSRTRLKILDLVLAIDHSPAQRNRALVCQAWIFEACRKPRAAENNYRRVISDEAYLEGDAFYIARAHLDLARLLEKLGRQSEAIEVLKSLIAYREEFGEFSGDGYFEIARLYFSMGDYDNADMVASAGVEWLGEMRPIAYYRLLLLLGKILYEKGEVETAAKLFAEYESEVWPLWMRAEARDWLKEKGPLVP